MEFIAQIIPLCCKITCFHFVFLIVNVGVKADFYEIQSCNFAMYYYFWNSQYLKFVSVYCTVCSLYMPE